MLQLWPMRRYKTTRVGCHVFLCMLACYVQRHMNQRLVPKLLAEEDPRCRRMPHRSPAQRFANAEQGIRTWRNAARDDGMSFKDLMDRVSGLTGSELIPKRAI